MLLVAILLMLTLGTCLSQQDMTPEEEQRLIDYVIELYYYPTKVKDIIKEYERPEKYDNYKKRQYFYNYINCVKESDILGVIDAAILSHTICISLCDEYPDHCKGALYSKVRSKCYLLKNVNCVPGDRLENVGREIDGWTVFFFYIEAKCEKDMNKQQQCEQSTTTTVRPQATTIAEKEKENEQVGQGEQSRTSVIQSVQTSITITMARSVVNPYQSVAYAAVHTTPLRQITPTSSRSAYKFRKLDNKGIRDLAYHITGSKVSTKPQSFVQAMDNIDSSLDKLEKSELTKHVEPVDKTKQHKPLERSRKIAVRPPPIDAPLNLPDAPVGDLIDLSVDCNKPTTSKQLSVSQPLSSRRKRKLPSLPSMEKCKKFVRKLTKTINSLKGKFDRIRNFKANMLQEIKQRMQQQFERLKNAKFGTHLKKLGGATRIGAFGLMAGTLMQDLLKGNFDHVAMNVGYFIVGIGTTMLAEQAAKYGSKLVAKGMLKAGWLMKAAAPFLQTVGTAIMVYEFYKSIRDLNTSDSDTVANAVANGILLGVELFELGVFVLVTAGVISTTSILVTVAGPIAIGIAAVVFAGLRIYQVVKEVERIKKKVQMSGWEIFLEGGKRFFSGTGLQHIKQIYDEKSANEKLRNIAIKTLQNSETMEVYFLPTTVLSNGQIEIAKERKIDLTKRGPIKYSRSAPDGEGNYETVCLPKHTTGEPLTKDDDYYCENAFGVKDKSSVNKNAVHFDLFEGTDRVLAKNATNTYTLGDGFKEITGNAGHDIFVLNGKTTSGMLEGKEGYDVLHAQYFHEDAHVNFDMNENGDLSINHFDHVHHMRQYITATSTEDIRGRPEQPDSVTVPCNTKYLNANGGKNKIKGRDMIFLKDSCNYNVTISVGHNTVLKNVATNGRFVYHATNITGNNFIHLTKGSYQNIFMFEYAIEEMIEMKKLRDNLILFAFKDYLWVNKVAKISIKNYDNQTVFAFKENMVIRIGDSNAYLTTVSNLSCTELVWKYKPMVYRAGLILKARSNRDQMAAVVGHGQKAFGVSKNDSKNVLSNDDKFMTRFYPGTVKNVYLIIADEEMYNGSINDFLVPTIFIGYDGIPSQTDQIDLSILAYKLKQAFGLSLFVEAIADRYEQTIKLMLYVINNQGEKIKYIGEINLIYALVNHAYENVVITYKSGFSINVEYPEEGKPGNMAIMLEPMNLSFDGKDHDIFIISEDDVSYGTIVEIDKELDDFDYFRHNDSLIITNAALRGIEASKMVSVLVHKFFKSELMRSIDLSFSDIFVPLKAYVNVHGLMNLTDSSDLFNRFYDKHE